MPRSPRDDRAAFSLMALLVVASLVGGPVLLVPATAYLWVSGFGSTSSAATVPAVSLGLASNGPLVDGEKEYAVSFASGGLTYARLAFTIDGVEQGLASSCEPSVGTVALCRGGFAGNATDEVRAGDTLRFAGLRSGSALRVIDVASNSVVLTMTVG